MSNFVFRINGVDVTATVIIKDATFTSAAKGAAGSADFRLRDEAHLYTVATGQSLTLHVDGELVWGGYVAKVERGYFFEADCRCKTAIIPRYLKITGTDYNVLLNKRVLYDHANPTDMELRRFTAGVYDDTILTYYLQNYTDIEADGVTLGMIERVGIPQTDDFFSGSPSWTINQFMQTLTSEQLGSIWYIDPEKHFVYTDVDTPNAPYGLSDDPGPGQKGFREMEIDFDGSGLRNDALAWGVGQGSDTPVFARSISQESIDEHGLWQYGSMSNAVWHQDTIQRIAHSAVFGSPQNQRGGKDDRVSIKCAVFEPSFRVAQKVAFESETFDYADVIPIRYQRITFPSHQQVRFDLVLAHDIDDPWTTLEFWWPNLDLPPFPPFPPIQIPQPPVLPPFDECSEVCGFIDRFQRTETDAWGQPDDDHIWESDLYSGLSVNANTGVMTHQDLGGGFWTGTNARLLGDIEFWDDTDYIEGTFDFTTPPILPNFGAVNLRLCDACGTGGQNFVGLNYGLSETDDLSARRLSTCNSATIGAAAFAWVGGATYTVRAKVDPYGIYLKVWPRGTPEPSAWNLTVTPTSFPTVNPFMTWDYLLVTQPQNETGPSTVRITNVCLVSQPTAECMCTDAACVETFTRSIAGSWGTTEFFCGDRLWYNSETADFYVNGEAGVIYGVDGVGGGAWVAVPDQWNGAPVEFVALVSTTQNDAILLTNSGVQFTLGYTGTNPNMPSDTVPAVFSNTGFVFRLRRLSDGTLQAWIQYLVQIDTFDLAGIAAGQDVWVKCRIDTGTAAMKIWADGDAEPGAFGATITVTNALSIVNNGATGGSGPANVFNAQKLAVSDTTFTVDQIEFTSGLTCTCGDCAPDAEVAPGVYMCENLTQIETPPNSSEEWVYYQASYQMAFGSDEVWVDGLRVDWRDYTVAGNRDIIAFYDPATVINENPGPGGGPGGAPPIEKTVHACYIATSIGVV